MPFRRPGVYISDSQSCCCHASCSIGRCEHHAPGFCFSPLARDRSSATCQIRAAIGVMSDSRTHKRLPPRSLAWIQGQGNGAVRLSFVACMQRGLVLPCLDDFASCGAIFAAGSWFSEPGMPKV